MSLPLALRSAALAIAKGTHRIDVVPETSPVGDSQSNGLVENAVKEIKGVARTLRHCLCELHNVEVPHGHPVLTWLVQHAAGCINRGQLGPYGQTAYYRWKGGPFKRSLPPFGEMVEFLPAGKRQTSTIGDRWLAGIYLGVVEKSSELISGSARRSCKPDASDAGRCPSGLTAKRF